MAKKKTSDFKKEFFLAMARKIDNIDWAIQKAWEKRSPENQEKIKEISKIKAKIAKLKVQAQKIFEKEFEVKGR